MTFELSSQSLSARLFTQLSKIIFKFFFRSRVLIAEKNIERSNLFKDSIITKQEIKPLIDRSLDHLALTLYHSLCRALRPSRKHLINELNELSLEQRLDHLNERGIELTCEVQLKDLLSDQRGIVFISAHIGAWEELIILGVLIGRPISIISKRMKISWAQRLWDLSRRSGAKRLDRGSSRGRIAVRSLRAGECIGAVIDQHDPRSSAIECQFLGRPAATSPDMIRAALIADARIVPIFMIRGSDRPGYTHRLHIFPVIDPRNHMNGERSKPELIAALTQRCCDEVAKAILMYPSQWLWIHRRWKLD